MYSSAHCVLIGIILFFKPIIGNYLETKIVGVYPFGEFHVLRIDVNHLSHEP